MSEISEKTQQLEKSAREKVSRENLKAHIDYLCSLGEKLAGTEEEAKACQYIVDRLKDAGLETTVYEFESFVSHPVSASFSRKSCNSVIFGGTSRYSLEPFTVTVIV